MAQDVDIKIEIIAPGAEEFALPETADVVWADALQSVTQEDAQSVLEAFYMPESEAADEPVTLENPDAGLSANADWLDYEESGLESVDLNDLLDAGSVSAELEAIAILGENASEDAPGPQASESWNDVSNSPDAAHLSQDLLFPSVTIVIDADSETDSVAL